MQQVYNIKFKNLIVNFKSKKTIYKIQSIVVKRILVKSMKNLIFEKVKPFLFDHFKIFIKFFLIIIYINFKVI